MVRAFVLACPGPSLVVLGPFFFRGLAGEIGSGGLLGVVVSRAAIFVLVVNDRGTLSFLRDGFLADQKMARRRRNKVGAVAIQAQPSAWPNEGASRWHQNTIEYLCLFHSVVM